MMKNQIIPSIIARTKAELNHRLSKVADQSDIIQLDVMDGKFVKNKSLLFDFELPKNKYYEAHLMMKDPRSWIKKNHNKVDTIIIHLESHHFEDNLTLLKKLKKKTGIAVNPKTFLSKLFFINMKEINTLLLMSVDPGKYGSPFVPHTIEKVRQARKLYLSLSIEVDGGINNHTIPSMKKAGANKFVVGSFLQKSKNVKRDFEVLKKLI